jgi:hypothetical protein
MLAHFSTSIYVSLPSSLHPSLSVTRSLSLPLSLKMPQPSLLVSSFLVHFPTRPSPSVGLLDHSGPRHALHYRLGYWSQRACKQDGASGAFAMRHRRTVQGDEERQKEENLPGIKFKVQS